MPEPLGSAYVLDELIGRGGMGEVWRGHRRDGRTFAFKLMQPQLAEDPTVVSRFLRERSILTQLDSPFVVPVRDLVAENGRLAIVMDLIDGSDLRRELAARGTFAPGEAAALTSDILRGLAAAHALGIVHRDVKPANVLLEPAAAGRLRPRVSDFGVAMFTEDGTRLTHSSGVIGTPAYMAPEQADHGDGVSWAADLYAVGVVLYELLCGVTPFVGRPMAVLRGHAERTPGRPDGIPDPLWEMISRLLAKNPADRGPGAAAAADFLAWLAPQLAGHPPAPRLTVPPTSFGQTPPAGAASRGAFPASTPDQTTQLPVVAGPVLAPHTPPPGSPPHLGAGAAAAANPPAARRGPGRGTLAAAGVTVVAVITLVVLLTQGGSGGGANAGNGGPIASGSPSPGPGATDSTDPGADSPVPSTATTDGASPTGSGSPTAATPSASPASTGPEAPPLAGDGHEVVYANRPLNPQLNQNCSEIPTINIDIPAVSQGDSFRIAGDRACDHRAVDVGTLNAPASYKFASEDPDACTAAIQRAPVPSDGGIELNPGDSFCMNDGQVIAFIRFTGFNSDGSINLVLNAWKP